MALNVIDVSSLTVAGTSLGLDSASPTKAVAFAAGARQALIVVEGAPCYIRQDGDAATSADVLLNVGDVVPMLGDNMNQVLDLLRFIRKTSTSATLKIIWYNREAVLTARLIRGAVRLITEAGDSVIDETADAVKVLQVNAAGVELAKAEDAAHTSGDKGIMALGVRKDTPISLAGTSGDYVPPQFDNMGNQRVVNSEVPMFGTPTLYAQGNAIARWQRGDTTIETEQKGSTSWVVELRPGTQSGWNDACEIEIPINEMPVGDFTSAAWTYWMKNAEAHGVNIGFGVHNPDNIGQRIQINQAPSQVALAKAAAWNSHNFDKTLASHCFYYEDAAYGATVLEGSTHLYSFNQIVQDTVFDSWTIYRIVISFGWYSTGVFESAYVADVILNGQVIQLKPSVEEQLEMVRDDTARALTTIPTWMFGEPSLSARTNGSASWAKTGISPLDQKSATGWLANLYGGVQTDWLSYARVEIPVNEMKVTDLTAAMWSYYMTEAESFGVNMVIWVHDPTDFDKRAEITQQADIATLIKAAGWNAHVLDTSVAQFYFYGEGESGNDICTTEGPPNYYTWAQYQSDAMFSTWAIYRISFEYGWQDGDDEFKDAWVADIKLNGQLIPLKPDAGGSGRFKTYRKTAASGDPAIAFAPQTPFKDLSVMLHLDAAATQENLTINVDAGASATYDTNLLTIAMGTNAVQNLIVREAGPFLADDVIDIDWANTDAKDYGITVSARTVFDV